MVGPGHLANRTKDMTKTRPLLEVRSVLDQCQLRLNGPGIGRKLLAHDIFCVQTLMLTNLGLSKSYEQALFDEVCKNQ
jgi:hypothetical protein